MNVLIDIQGTHGVELEGDDGPYNHEGHGEDVGGEAGQQLPVGDHRQDVGRRNHLNHLDCLSLEQIWSFSLQAQSVHLFQCTSVSPHFPTDGMARIFLFPISYAVIDNQTRIGSVGPPWGPSFRGLYRLSCRSCGNLFYLFLALITISPFTGTQPSTLIQYHEWLA